LHFPFRQDIRAVNGNYQFNAKEASQDGEIEKSFCRIVYIDELNLIFSNKSDELKQGNWEQEQKSYQTNYSMVSTQRRLHSQLKTRKSPSCYLRSEKEASGRE